MASISFKSTNSLFQPLFGCEIYLVIEDPTTSSPSSPQGYFADFVWSQIGVHGETNLQLARGCAKRLKPQRDDIVLDNFYTMEGLKVVLGLLPTSCARHNTPSKSHAVSLLVQRASLTGKCAVVLRSPKKEYVLAQAIAAVRPFALYNIKSNKIEGKTTVEMIIDTPGVDQEHLNELDFMHDGVRLCQRLVDMPPNILHTDAYVQECLDAVAGIPNTSISIIQGKELEAKGFGGLWGVGKASEHLPALVVMSYMPPTIVSSESKGGHNDQSICLVGKGIVYDTGGLSIKSKEGMPNMKTDMGGSAAVLGAFTCIAKRGTTVRVHALMCISENSVGMLATRPDDVQTFLSGKTVEVNNTDAEGRLVLADGCYHAASTLNPKVIIDIATLTGAQGIATGKRHAAIYSDEELEKLIVQVGKDTGDLAHPLPYCPEFFRPEFASRVADMKNSVANRMNAQSSCAAQFIGNHIEDWLANGGKWCHIDMAAPSSANGRATGYGVALLSKLVDDLAISTTI